MPYTPPTDEELLTQANELARMFDNGQSDAVGYQDLEALIFNVCERGITAREIRKYPFLYAAMR